ncbi:MAG: hypothetical protein WC755_04660 [Candidatus Woesearchaeota archaeon]|jgi:hypothetical protein
MFKTDKKSIEQLSFGLNENNLATIKSFFDYVKSEKLCTSNKEIDNALKILNESAKLRLDGKIYGFHVYEEGVFNESEEGVALYLRHGNSLKDYFVDRCMGSCYTAEEAANFLKEQKKSVIYTGRIPYVFLGITSDINDSALHDFEIEEFESQGIKVITLDSLM